MGLSKRSTFRFFKIILTFRPEYIELGLNIIILLICWKENVAHAKKTDIVVETKITNQRRGKESLNPNFRSCRRILDPCSLRWVGEGEMLGLAVISLHTLETVVNISYSRACVLGHVSLIVLPIAQRWREAVEDVWPGRLRKRFICFANLWPMDIVLSWVGVRDYLVLHFIEILTLLQKSWLLFLFCFSFIAIIQMFEHRRTVEIDLAERYGSVMLSFSFENFER